MGIKRFAAALGLALVAALGMSAVASMSASATGVGHFTSEFSHPKVIAAQEGEENEFRDEPLPPITCETADFEGQVLSSTVTSVSVNALFGECSTSLGALHVSMNGCQFVATIETHASTTHNKVHLVCPTATKHVTIEATSFLGTCTITFPEQSTKAGGVKYTTGGAAGNTHNITVVVTVQEITSTRHPMGFGSCAFAGTNSTSGELVGQATAIGLDTEGNQVGITATGSTGG